MLESEFLVDTYGRDISAVPDNSDDLTVAAFTAGVDHSRQQRCSDTLARVVRVNVNGVFDGEAIRHTRAVERRIRIANHHIVFFSDKVRQPTASHLQPAARHFFRVRCADFERASAM